MVVTLSSPSPGKTDLRWQIAGCFILMPDLSVFLINLPELCCLLWYQEGSLYEGPLGTHVKRSTHVLLSYLCSRLETAQIKEIKYGPNSFESTSQLGLCSVISGEHGGQLINDNNFLQHVGF